MYVCIQQTSVNAQGLVQLAARIERITPIIEDMAQTNPSKGQTIVQELQRSAPRLRLNKINNF
jgi:hypothetical protein